MRRPLALASVGIILGIASPPPSTLASRVGSGLRRGLTSPLTWLVLVLALVFYKEVFLGRVFSPADQLFDYPPWQTVRPVDYQHSSNYMRSDESFIAFPRRLEIAHDLRQYGLPLWQDHTFAGSPNTLSLHVLGGFVYPPMLGYLLLAAGLATTVLHLSVPLSAGLCMYVLMTRVSRFPWVRFFASLAWALNGYMIVWLSSFTLPLTVGTMPLLIYLAWRFLEERRILAGAAYAGLLGWTFFLAYPPANILVLAGVAIFAIAWCLGQSQIGVQRLAELAGLTTIGLGIGGLGILTDIGQLAHVATQQFRGQPTGLPLKNLQTFLFPNVYGNPTAFDWRGTFGNYPENIAYVGGLTMVLALAWFLLTVIRRRRPDPLTMAAIGMGGLSLGLAYRVWPFSLIESLPILTGVRPARWQIGIVFAAILLAAGALDALAGKAMPRWAVGWAAGLVGLLAVVLLVVHRHDFGAADRFIVTDYVLRAALLFVGAGVLLLLISRPQALVVVAGGLLAIDLFTFGVDFNPAIKPAELYPSTPALRVLQARAPGYRVLGALKGGGLWPGDVLNVYGIDSLTGYDHLRDERLVRLLGTNLSGAEVDFWRSTGYLTLGQQLNLEDPVFRLLNVKDVYFPNETTAPAVPSGWHAVYTGRDGVVLESDQALPKQFVVLAGSAQPVPVAHTPAAPDHDRLTVDGPGLLVWSRPFSQDWQVTVNGRSAPAVSYQDYFLAVQLEQGPNNIALAYRPRLYYLGAALSAAFFILLVGLLVWPRLPTAGRRRRSSPFPIRFPRTPSHRGPG